MLNTQEMTLSQHITCVQMDTIKYQHTTQHY